VSWRAGFFLNVPIGIAMVLAARRFIIETGHHGGRFDLSGALCATLGMIALVFGIVNSTDVGWTAPITVGAFIAGAAFLAGLVLNEARAGQPIPCARRRTVPYRRLGGAMVILAAEERLKEIEG